jgi:hypothetical protein
MGLPDNRDIEPVREDLSSDQPEFVRVFNIINFADEQTGEDDDNGYLRLQTYEGDDQPANDSDTDDSNDDEEDENWYTFPVENIEENVEAQVENVDSSIPSIMTADNELQAQVWNEPRVQDTIELNTEKTQQILKAMSQFKLANVPAWANEVNSSELVKAVLSKKESAAPSDRK